MKTKNKNLFSPSLWSDKDIAIKISKEIKNKAEMFFKKTGKKPSMMEVCGTHTMAIARSGIRQLIGDYVNLISGPGCPVCVTSQGDIDRIIEFSKFNDVIIATFGDMMKVKGSEGYDLNDIRIKGGDVRIVYSPMDCLELARENRGKNIVFVGVGFETTAPTIAAAVKKAYEDKINNFFVAPLFKLVPPALRFLLDSKISKIDGFILPGHVSVIIGSKAYDFLKEEYKIQSVIAGFEPLDILRAADMILSYLIEGKEVFGVEYERAVKSEGNRVALDIMNEVFKVSDAYWRAIGVIKKSGYSFSDKFEKFDAFKKYGISYREKAEPKGCLCGRILLGLSKPSDCPLFGKKCVPEDAIGPCMVSSEGACAAWYKYGVKK
ncbi:MAG: hydrogenase formation protein HypD [Elusimicrobiales bacterium]|nr:hydrogenase formation protein HypD [Elusimicrobiales bacterium]